MKGINKARYTFFASLVETWLGLPAHYTVLNLGRFGSYCEKSIRLHFQKPFDFATFNSTVIKPHCGKSLIAAFDPSYVPKSGKRTPGLGKWWSGKDQFSLRGLEAFSMRNLKVMYYNKSLTERIFPNLDMT